MIDRKESFARIRREYGSLNQKQVDGFNAIFDAWDKGTNTDTRHLAYMLATAWHETDKTMQAIEEYGKGKGKPYGKYLKYEKDKKGKHVPYSDVKTLFYGRGLVQLTWYDLYERVGNALNLDLLNHPELALDLNNAVKIMFYGMEKGIFTSRKLSHYFNTTINDPLGARKIINGTDCNELIKTYYTKFINSIILE